MQQKEENTIKNSMHKQCIVAICYDFDKTLSTKDMQEYHLIPNLLKYKNSQQFWEECNAYAKQEGMDSILACMYFTLKKARENNIQLTEVELKSLGQTVKLFAGLDSWFVRINQFANSLGILLEHYIISAGMKEIIQGTSIAKYFHKIFATSYHYDENGCAIWLNQVVNYTAKTQYLVRINKGCLDLTDEETVNKEIPEEERRIPYRNMIYIGDSVTDIAAMRMLKNYGGESIAVYTENIAKVEQLLLHRRVDYIVPTNYEKNSPLEYIIQNILKKMKIKDTLLRVHDKQVQLIEYSQDIQKKIEGSLQMIQDTIASKCPTQEEAKQYLSSFKKFLKENIELKVDETLLQKYPVFKSLHQALQEKLKKVNEAKYNELKLLVNKLIEGGKE